MDEWQKYRDWNDAQGRVWIEASETIPDGIVIDVDWHDGAEHATATGHGVSLVLTRESAEELLTRLEEYVRLARARRVLSGEGS